jgi:hypothetical protein
MKPQHVVVIQVFLPIITVLLFSVKTEASVRNDEVACVDTPLAYCNIPCKNSNTRHKIVSNEIRCTTCILGENVQAFQRDGLKKKCYVDMCKMKSFKKTRGFAEDRPDECAACPLMLSSEAVKEIKEEFIAFFTDVFGNPIPLTIADPGMIMSDYVWIGENSGIKDVSCARLCNSGFYYSNDDCQTCGTCAAGSFAVGCYGVQNSQCLSCPLPQEPSKWRKGCGGTTVGTIEKCADAGQNQYFDPKCEKFTEGTLLDCPVGATRVASDPQTWSKCGDGIKQDFALTDCTNDRTATTPLYNIPSLKSNTDNTCGICAPCEAFNTVRTNCGNIFQEPVCEDCKCPSGEFVPARTRDGVEAICERSYRIRRDNVDVWYNKMTCVSCSLMGKHVSAEIFQNTHTTLAVCNAQSVHSDPNIQCTECLETEYESVPCANFRARKGDRFVDPNYNALVNRQCAPCNALGDCQVGFYRHCGWESQTTLNYIENADCRQCKPCEAGHFIDNCKHNVYSALNRGGTCTLCGILCAPGFKQSTVACVGTTTEDTSVCEACPEKPAFSSWSNQHDSLLSDNCEWKCDASYYRTASGICVLCSSDVCSRALYRPSCPAGSVQDSECRPCEKATCQQGQYTEVCDGTTVIDIPAVCRDCNEDVCPAGRSRSACVGTDFDDATCVLCEFNPLNSTKVSQCSWMCDEGFYKQQGECVQCITSAEQPQCQAGALRETCVQGLAMQDALCICGTGLELFRDFTSSYCRFCKSHKFNDNIGGRCRSCAVGSEGSSETGTGSASCKQCSINYFRNSSMSACEFCPSGSGGFTGAAQCNECPSGFLVRQDEFWMGLVWDYTTMSFVLYRGNPDIPSRFCLFNDCVLNPKRVFALSDQSESMAEITWLKTQPQGDSPQRSSGVKLGEHKPQPNYECIPCADGEIFLK